MGDQEMQKLFFSHLAEYNRNLGDIRQFMGDIRSTITAMHDDRQEIKGEIFNIKNVEIKELKKSGDAFWKFKAQMKTWGTVAFLISGFLQSAVLVILSRVLSTH